MLSSLGAESQTLHWITHWFTVVSLWVSVVSTAQKHLKCFLKYRCHVSTPRDSKSVQLGPTVMASLLGNGSLKL